MMLNRRIVTKDGLQCSLGRKRQPAPLNKNNYRTCLDSPWTDETEYFLRRPRNPAPGMLADGVRDGC